MTPFNWHSRKRIQPIKGELRKTAAGYEQLP
jgi:hypothetical protein